MYLSKYRFNYQVGIICESPIDITTLRALASALTRVNNISLILYTLIRIFIVITL